MRLSIAQHKRESGGVHILNYDTSSSGLASFGDEIPICPGGLIMLLVLRLYRLLEDL